jgi:hypothetical protein
VVLNYFFSTMVAPWHGADGHPCFRTASKTWRLAVGEIAKWLLQFSGDHHLRHPTHPSLQTPPLLRQTSAAVAATVATAAAVVVVAAISAIVPAAVVVAIVLVSPPPPPPSTPSTPPPP